MSQEQLTSEQLYALYLKFNDEFLEENPENEAYRLFGVPPSLEVFEQALKNMDGYPEEKKELIQQLHDGYKASLREVVEAQNAIDLRMGKRDFRKALKNAENVAAKKLYPWVILRLFPP